MKPIWIILLDTSDSMNEPLSLEGIISSSRLEATKLVFKNMLYIERELEVALIPFTDKSEIVFKGDGTNIIESLDQIRNSTAVGESNLDDALELSLKLLRSENYFLQVITIIGGNITPTQKAERLADTIASEFPSVKINTKLLVNLPRINSFAKRISINGNVDSIESIGDLVYEITHDRDIIYNKTEYRIRSKPRFNLYGVEVGINDIIIKLIIPFKNNGVEVEELISILYKVEESLYESDYQDVKKFFNGFEHESSKQLEEEVLMVLDIYQNRRFKIIHSTSGSIEIIGIVLAVSAFIISITIGESLKRGYEGSKMDKDLTELFKSLFNGKFNSVLIELKKMFIKEDEKNVEILANDNQEDYFKLITLKTSKDQKNENNEIPTYEEIIEQRMK